MTSYQFTPEATTDLSEIWDFIALDSVEAAGRVESAIFQACELLGRAPMLGHSRRELTKLPLRFWPVRGYSNYLIVYDPSPQPIRVVRIIHGARNLPEILV
jgi:plasmid stabilization system protein ParE